MTDCPNCNGTGKEYEGDIIVGECDFCGGSGYIDDDIDSEFDDVEIDE